jgi:hypothetical protein
LENTRFAARQQPQPGADPKGSIGGSSTENIAPRNRPWKKNGYLKRLPPGGKTRIFGQN